MGRRVFHDTFLFDTVTAKSMSQKCFSTTQWPSQEFELMGSKPFGEIEKLPHFSAIQFQNVIFYRNSSKIDGFENPSFKIDAFGGTHRVHAD